MTDQVTENPLAADIWAASITDADVTEAGGEHNNEGVDFSRYWAMSRLLEMEEAGASDYAIIFEFLQDVLILNSPSTPSQATLYQIKKKEKGSWSRSELCSQKSHGIRATDKQSKSKRSKALKAQSALGKLYLATERVPTNVTGVFLSNAGYSLRMPTGETCPGFSRTGVALLHDEDKKFVQSKN